MCGNQQETAYKQGVKLIVEKNIYTKIEYDISCAWSDEQAKYVYQLNKYTSWYRDSFDKAHNTAFNVEQIATGDKDWAEKIANHYDLIMPSEYDSNVLGSIDMDDLVEKITTSEKPKKA